MSKELIYVFCTSNNPVKFGRKLGSICLKSLLVGSFYIVIKYVSDSEFSEENFKNKLSDTQWLESNVKEHIGVITMIMETNTVIPFKFGTIYNTRRSLRKFISDYSGSLIENFNNIKGKEEWSVKIYCYRKALCRRIDDYSEEAATLETQIMASSPGKAFLLKRKKDEVIEREMDRLSKIYGQSYYDELTNLSESANINSLIPKEYTGREESMILNANLLIDKKKVTDFMTVVENLRKRDENSGFSIEVTGPWPAFSFIHIKE